MATQDSKSIPDTIQNLIGKTYGRLTVVGYSHRKPRKDKENGYRYIWHCVCICGNEHLAAGRDLRPGRVKSCGCLVIDKATKHGMEGTTEYNSWRGMVDRVKHPDKYYEELDIDICKEWLDFENFFADMGPKPSPRHSIDRIDNSKGYHPDNCRWATRIQQNNNSRHNRMITFRGETMTAAQWARRMGIKPRVLYVRLHMGWSVERALTQPVRK